MDKKLQKEILKVLIIKKEPLSSDGIYNNLANQNELMKNDIKAQINFLIDDNAIKIDVKIPNGNYFTTYRITEWGILKEGGGIQKWWYWLINKNHNFISFIAVAISIFALLFSVFYN